MMLARMGSEYKPMGYSRGYGRIPRGGRYE